MSERHRGVVAALVLAALAGCTSPGALVVPAEQPRARSTPPRPDPAGILLLYAHGSRQEFQRDRCYPGSVTTPRWLRGFAGEPIAGLPVTVYAVCTPSRTGDYRHRERAGRPKVEQRARDLEVSVRRFVDEGFAPRRIFLLGHSAGGWASLWAARDGEPPVAGVIAFAPAFAGPRRGRSEGWQWLREAHVAELRQSAHLPALVFAYRGDPFETPTTLGFLRTIPGVQLVALDPGGCTRVRPHRAVFSSCVMDARQRARMRAFIEHRLRPPAAQSPPATRYHDSGDRPGMQAAGHR